MTKLTEEQKLDRQLNQLALERVYYLKDIELQELEGDRDMLQKEIDSGDKREIQMFYEIKDAIKETELVMRNIAIDLEHGAIGDS